MDYLKNLSENLLYLSEQKDGSQAETCRNLEYSTSKWSNYITGTSKPGLDDFIKMMDYFEVSASDILERNLRGAKYVVNGSKNANNSNDIIDDYKTTIRCLKKAIKEFEQKIKKNEGHGIKEHDE